MDARVLSNPNLDHAAYIRITIRFRGQESPFACTRGSNGPPHHHSPTLSQRLSQRLSAHISSQPASDHSSLATTPTIDFYAADYAALPTMHPTKILFLALAFLFALSSAISAQVPASADALSDNMNRNRFLRTSETTDEERGISLDALRSELSFMKLNWAARHKESAEVKLLTKQAKSQTKLEDTLAKNKIKVDAKAARAQQKVEAQALKAQQKLAAHKAKAEQQLEALKAKELQKKAKELAKNDKRYNQWLVADETPDDVFKNFKFDKMVKKGIDPTTSPNYKHYENYQVVFHNRYPNLPL
ncbi:hypothetical protein PHYPSEUDO_008094 [Phytophthora pseudosyringae]|uniref:RxLR effector protein n=1 Tax=Phytophthora pseudosyringae TaxID=221518 RepID=A0A8T1VFW0_9STRA|nr:hypothetical protein PHYPSEUDO_008094 [Phytophthora pseudosyringae]